MKRVIIVGGVLLGIVLLLATGAVWYGWNLMSTPAVSHGIAPSPVVIEIERGQSVRSVGRWLEKEGLVPRAALFEAYVRWTGTAGRIQAGRYSLDPALTPRDYVNQFVAGDAIIDDIVVSIPEGWSLFDIEVYFENLGLFPKERFQQAAVMQERYRNFPLLDHLEDDTILDGYLFPDTYRVFPDSTPESIVVRMVTTFHDRMSSELLDEIRRQDRTIHDVLSLASIVQKESATDGEMPLVAGVFWNRLQMGMRLESDATVNYVLGTRKLQPTFADTEIDHPYNTYENYGLPPGPVGNPGLPAIRAAVYPAEHDYLFFLHKPDREIVPSRSFAEHLENKARYLD
ncbi:MAG: endolytic transglycosylase MltG [Alkalispirochaeta sp.]